MPGDDTNWGPMLGLGLQVAVGVGLGLLVGMWLDKRFGWTPWGLVCGAALGFAGGLYNLVREGMRANRDPPARGPQHRKPPGTGTE